MVSTKPAAAQVGGHDFGDWVLGSPLRTPNASSNLCVFDGRDGNRDAESPTSHFHRCDSLHWYDEPDHWGHRSTCTAGTVRPRRKRLRQESNPHFGAI